MLQQYLYILICFTNNILIYQIYNLNFEEKYFQAYFIYTIDIPYFNKYNDDESIK